MLKNLAACVALAAGLTSAAHAQQSAFQDAGGESSIYLREGGGYARVNPTDKSVQVGFLRDTGGSKPWFGLDFTGKASGGFAALFNGGTPSPEAEVGLTLGKRFLTMRSDAAILSECINQTVLELQNINLDTLILQARKDFIDRRIFEITQELQAARDEVDVQKLTIETWNELFAAEKAKDKDLPDAVAAGIATAATPKAVEAKLAAKKLTNVAERAEAQARLEAESDAGKAEIRDLALDSAKGEASNLCAEESPDLEREAYDWLSFRASYKRASYKLLNESAAFADQVRKQSFDGFSAKFAYNRMITLDDLSGERSRRIARRAARRENRPELERETEKVRSRGAVILGASLGVERRNNSDDLKSVDLEDQPFTSSSGTTQRRAISKQTVFRGEYKEFIAVPLNTDIVWFPGRFSSRIAVDIFTRSNLGETNRKFVPGVGLFLTKEKSPTKVVGGLSFSVDDGKGKVGLVGGFHF